MTASPGHDNPQLTLDSGHPSNVTVDCGTCRRTVDITGEHWSVTTGRAPRLDQLAVAHHDPDADDGGICFTSLRARWLNLAALHHAGTLAGGPPQGYWTLLGDDLHCGTPLQILTATGTWLDGHYEIAHTPRGPRPVLYIALGGLNNPDAPLDIPAHALLRQPHCQQR
jgi:hypothetical protein